MKTSNFNSFTTFRIVICDISIVHQYTLPTFRLLDPAEDSNDGIQPNQTILNVKHLTLKLQILTQSTKVIPQNT
jgi:hypothetical protein